MQIIRAVKHRKQIMGKLSHGADLLGALTEICEKECIHLGRLEALGAVQKACVGFYDQKKREYEYTSRWLTMRGRRSAVTWLPGRLCSLVNTRLRRWMASRSNEAWTKRPGCRCG